MVISLLRKVTTAIPLQNLWRQTTVDSSDDAVGQSMPTTPHRPVKETLERPSSRLAGEGRGQLAYTATRSSAWTAGRRSSPGNSEVDRPIMVANSVAS
ncbi:hypothetical protein DSM43518_02559 [Mycobacterium marinum]|nr:hypothetical protein MM1218R_03839 [Mycobacterium marinum]AXN51113.1 hypothetical protein CCUG20998_03712 [Mycobacterium marinum]RFZ07674.1 hypothetical protein DE4381_02750 [Mycobacterium marinum]RFZ09691.1 hypothetical protein DSM43518_02559 [Mycobacterium marinum]RFZ22966.1 hypothetical protein DSM43519_02771 [Mycobacterium marinum]